MDTRTVSTTRRAAAADTLGHAGPTGWRTLVFEVSVDASHVLDSVHGCGGVVQA